MARSSLFDPIEKFRFQVTIFDNIAGLITQGSSTIGTTLDSDILSRGGFSEASVPRVTIKEITYRENTHGNSPMKQAGLATHEPITLKRGVTKDKGLYNWYKQVNDDAASLNKFSDTLAGLSAVPFQDPTYRREVLISAMDRNGNFTKHWLLYNAWPAGYKGADDFDAKTSEISVEEVVITYESFLEVTGRTTQEALRKAREEAEKSTKKAGIAGAISSASGLLNRLF